MLPSKVDIRDYSMPVSRVLENLESGRIVYGDSKKTPEEMSRIIESLLLRIPLPSAFYKTDGGTLLCFEGKSVMHTLDCFCLQKELRLQGLECFPELNGMGWDDLHNKYKRRIKETIWTGYTIERNVEKDVQQEIISRYREML